MFAMSVVPDTLTMDLDADSTVQSERWDPLLHKRQGIHIWDPERFGAYRTDQQQKGVTALPGRYLFNEAKNMPILNGNGVDFLLQHQYLIPAKLRPYNLFAWGTIYYERTSGREPFVRGLYWSGNRWEEIDLPVDGSGFTARCAALMYIGVKAHGNQAEL